MVLTRWALAQTLAAIPGMSGMLSMLSVYNQESGYRELHNAFLQMSVSSVIISMLFPWVITHSNCPK